jgi:predicted nucleotidyltransferase
LAVAVRAEPRFTRDVDLALSVGGDDEAEALVHRLSQLGYAVLTHLEHDVTGRLASVRVQPPSEESEALVVDLLFASSGIEPEVVACSEMLEIVSGLAVHVARTGHLIALKLLATEEDRPQDRVDIRALISAADDDDIALARSAVGLIAERGYARGRDLTRALEEVL